ncbi:CLUMA_CG005488, isoform A [Clunio marinus]|uniref:Amine oxidase n=1 Tax=Clunio marinus TaxID=568069 RepID=A0A1J1HV38_9DIPT|nr:CLUMA_CG005488, isoform A [Clunio marinus]
MELSKTLNVFKKFILFFLSLHILQIESQASENRHKVVIIGAGISGYSAAARLIENGVEDIVILEAENRTGGRIHSVPYRDGFIDLGAQWVHGQDGNIIYERFSNYFDFGDTGFDFADYYFHQSDGVSLNQNHTTMLDNLANEVLWNSFDRMVHYGGSFGSFFERFYTKGLMNQKFINVPWALAHQMQDYHHNRVNTYFGTTSWFDISAQIMAAQGTKTGSNWLTWRQSGYKTVFDFITKKLPDPSQYLDVESKIQLNKEVTNIAWGDNLAIIKCADGSEYTADYVVFTASHGVLRAHYESLFTPKLPDRKILAIENIGYGSLEKIFLEFAIPFWPTDPNWVQYTILWSQEDINAVTGTDREWLLDTRAFFKVDGFPNLLSAFFIGANIKDFEQFTGEKIANDCMWLLERSLRKSLPRPINVQRTQWITEKNFLGSYSILSMDTARNGVSPFDLAEPLFNSNRRPIIFFAGEATYFAFTGYTDGAMASGYLAADEILRHSHGNRNTFHKYLSLIILFYASLSIKI